MDRPIEHNDKDTELADFTDRLLNSKADQTASNPDEELRGLEKTILRLSGAFPPKPLDDASVKQMLVRLKARERREEERNSKPSFWKRFFDFQSNPQVGLIFAAAAVVALVVISLPSLGMSDPSTAGSAGSGATSWIVIGLAGVLLVIYWISRRK
jgi:hypothetical protein